MSSNSLLIRELSAAEIFAVDGAGDAETVGNVCNGVSAVSVIAGIAGIFVAGPVGVAIAVGSAMTGAFSLSCSVAVSNVSND